MYPLTVSFSAAISLTDSFRYAFRIRTEQSGGAWCPKQQITRDVYEWLQVDLGRLKVISLVETQGRFGNGQVQSAIRVHNKFSVFFLFCLYQRTYGRSQDFPRGLRGGTYGTQIQKQKPFFSLMNVAYIFLEKTEAHLDYDIKSINLQEAKRHRQQFCSVFAFTERDTSKNRQRARTFHIQLPKFVNIALL